MRSQEVLIDRGLVLNILLHLQSTKLLLLCSFQGSYQVCLTGLLGVYGAVEPL